MGNRQLRISDSAVIIRKLHELTGKKIHVVLDSNVAYSGIVRGISGDNVVIENMLNKKVTYPVKSLSEIYIDAHT
jgi:hypothetical protein